MKGFFFFKGGGYITSYYHCFLNKYDIKKGTLICMELSRRTIQLFPLVLERSSSSFRRTKLFFQVFHIIAIKDTNLEDLFKGSISVFGIVGF